MCMCMCMCMCVCMRSCDLCVWKVIEEGVGGVGDGACVLACKSSLTSSYMNESFLIGSISNALTHTVILRLSKTFRSV